MIYFRFILLSSDWYVDFFSFFLLKAFETIFLYFESIQTTTTTTKTNLKDEVIFVYGNNAIFFVGFFFLSQSWFRRQRLLINLCFSISLFKKKQFAFSRFNADQNGDGVNDRYQKEKQRRERENRDRSHDSDDDRPRSGRDSRNSNSNSIYIY